MPKDDMLGKEIERLIAEVLMDATPLEKAVVKQQLILVTTLAAGQGFPARIHRLVAEVLHRYYCICEGLEK